MKDKKKIKITVAMRKTTTKEKIIGGIVWGILIRCIKLYPWGIAESDSHLGLVAQIPQKIKKTYKKIKI